VTSDLAFVHQKVQAGRCYSLLAKSRIRRADGHLTNNCKPAAPIRRLYLDRSRRWSVFPSSEKALRFPPCACWAAATPPNWPTRLSHHCQRAESGGREHEYGAGARREQQSGQSVIATGRSARRRMWSVNWVGDGGGCKTTRSWPAGKHFPGHAIRMPTPQRTPVVEASRSD